MRLIKVLASSLVVASGLALNPIGASAEWKQDSKGWWNTEGSSYSTGWKEIHGDWYYFNSDGYMAYDTSINGYYLNSSGAWKNAVSKEEAKKVIEKYEEKRIQYDTSFKLTYLGEISKVDDSMTFEWNDINFTKNTFYNLINTNENVYYYRCGVMDNYFVGKETGRIYYFAPGNGVAGLELIEGGNSIKSWSASKPNYYWS